MAVPPGLGPPGNGGSGGGNVGSNVNLGDVLPPKRQAVVDRLRRRIENYRRRQNDCIPRFDQSFNGFCEQNIQETLLLKQRFLETKSKRAAKKTDKKQDPPSSLQNSLHGGRPGSCASLFGPSPTQDPGGAKPAGQARVRADLFQQQKFLKRAAEELDASGNGGDAFEPPAKLQCTTGAGQPTPQQGQQQQTPNSASENLTKFSVEIVQQLEFTSSAQPQQISTNVTVKAVKTDVPQQSAPASPKSSNDIGNLVECKQEPDAEFVDLEQCAAALEKDGANGATFPALTDLIGDDTSDEIMNSDALKDLISEISEISDYDVMKVFDFEDKGVDGLTNSNGAPKVEDDKSGQTMIPGHGSPNPMLTNPQFSPQSVYDPQGLTKSRMAPYSGLDFAKVELNPAAQTLKQMAEQHQVKSQLGMGFSPSAAAGVRNVRSPYGEFGFSGAAAAGADFRGSKTPQPPPQAAPQPQYSPYGSPASHGSPQYLPQRAPRPPSAPLQINQAQQMQISQQQIQVSAGQHMQLTGELKPGAAVAAQQGMYFSQGPEYSVSQSQTINFTQQSLRQRPPRHTPLDQQQKLLQQQQQQQMLRPQRPPPPEYKVGPQQIFQQQARFNMRRVPQQPMPPSAGPMMRPQQQPQQPSLSSLYMSQPSQHRLMGPGPTYPAMPQRNHQRPANVSVAPDWRQQLFVSQQQSAVFGSQMRPGFQPQHQASYGLGSSALQGGQLVRTSGMSASPVGQMPMLPQQQTMGMPPSGPGPGANQMSMSLQMSQSMSVTGSGSPHHMFSASPGPQMAPVTSSQQSMPTSDFSLEFLEQLPTGDNQFQAAAQELLNSLETGAPFNLQDINF